MGPHKKFPEVLLAVLLLFLLQGAAFFVRTYGPESFVCNSGGPFGIEVALIPWRIVVGGALLSFLLLWARTREQKASFLWLCICAAGGSNLLERLTFGCVADYLKLPLWPLFNMADVVLSVSVVFLLWREIQRKE